MNRNGEKTLYGEHTMSVRRDSLMSQVLNFVRAYAGEFESTATVTKEGQLEIIVRAPTSVYNSHSPRYVFAVDALTGLGNARVVTDARGAASTDNGDVNNAASNPRCSPTMVDER